MKHPTWIVRSALFVILALRLPVAGAAQSPLDVFYSQTNFVLGIAVDDRQVQLRSFYDTSFGDQFLLYLESGVLGRFDEQSKTEWDLPIRSIVNDYPTDGVTLYSLVSATPSHHPDLGTVSFQIGAGAKFELIPGIQIEALTSTFPLGINAGAGVTYNFGLRLPR